MIETIELVLELEQLIAAGITIGSIGFLFGYLSRMIENRRDRDGGHADEF